MTVLIAWCTGRLAGWRVVQHFSPWSVKRIVLVRFGHELFSNDSYIYGLTLGCRTVQSWLKRLAAVSHIGFTLIIGLRLYSAAAPALTHPNSYHNWRRYLTADRDWHDTANCLHVFLSVFVCMLPSNSSNKFYCLVCQSTCTWVVGALGNYNMNTITGQFLRQMTNLLAALAQRGGYMLESSSTASNVRRLRLNARMYVKNGTDSLTQKCRKSRQLGSPGGNVSWRLGWLG